MGNNKFAEECLKAHNKYRSSHGVPPLKQNKAISKIAQKWADHLAKENSLNHSAATDRTLKGQQMGENIAMKGTSTGEDLTGQEATDMWYDEIEQYDFQKSSGRGTGHFTQVVWKESREFGVGKAKSNDGEWFVVANYLPAGNLQGAYKENVLPLTNDQTGRDKANKGKGCALCHCICM